MAKRIHLDFLNYLLDHEHAQGRHCNRYYVIKARLNKDYWHFKFTIDQAKTHLINAGFISEKKHPGQMYLTDQGKEFLQQKNVDHHMLNMNYFKPIANKKHVTIASLFLIGIIGSIYVAQTKPMHELKQSLVVSLNNV
jgi:hypothetical protein